MEIENMSIKEIERYLTDKKADKIEFKQYGIDSLTMEISGNFAAGFGLDEFEKNMLKDGHDVILFALDKTAFDGYEIVTEENMEELKVRIKKIK